MAMAPNEYQRKRIQKLELELLKAEARIRELELTLYAEGKDK